MGEKITTEVQGQVLLIGLNRADKRNAMDPEMYHQLAAAYGRLDREPALRCGVLHAHGEHFTAGLELNKWAPIFASDGGWPSLKDDEIDPFGLNAERRLSKPLIFAAEGLCLTLGVELMLAADIRIIANNTRMAQIEVQRGIYPVGGATVRLPREIGWGNAMRYLLTGDDIPVDEALRWGLVQQVLAPGEPLAAAITLAQHVAAQAPLAVQALLRSARKAQSDGERAAIADFLPDLQPIMRSADVREGVQSFVERRRANFTGQ